MENLLGGVRLYWKKLNLFTRNAKMVLVYSALTGLAFGVFRLLFNFYVLSLGGYDEEFLGLLTSLSSAAAMSVAVPAAYLAERFSQKRIMIVTGLVSALAFLGLVLFPFRAFLILFNLVSGLAMSIRQVSVAPFLMSNTSEEERQYVFSFSFGMRTTAAFVGNWIGGSLPAWLGGWAGVGPTDTLAYQLALGSMMLISILAVGPLTFIRESTSQSQSQPNNPFRQIFQHGRQLFKLITPQVIIGLGAGLMMPFMNIYYRNVFGRSDAVIGTLFALGSLTMGIAQFTSPPLADRLGKVKAVVLTQGLSVPFLLTLGLAAWVVPTGRGDPSFWFLIAAVAYLFRLALMNMSGPVYQTFILEQVRPDVQALAASLNNIAFRFGWFVSPYVSGWFQTNYGFVPVFLSTSTLYVIGILVTWAFFHDAEQPVEKPQPVPAGAGSLRRAQQGD